MNNQPWPICVALVLAAIATLPALAADYDYDVELIVFRNVEPGSDDSRLPEDKNVFADTDAGNTPGADIARAEDTPGPDFVRLAATDMQLGTIARRLQNSRLYEPVLHIAWRQPGLSPGRASAYRIAGGEGAARVDGQVTMSLERYLHLNIDLGFAFRGVTYTLRERRRMRSRETHFFDHPRFGIIARITPAG